MEIKDQMQMMLHQQAIQSHSNIFNKTRKMKNRSVSPADMYSFQFLMLDHANALFMNSYYTQFKHSVRKSAIDAIN